eukprot:scaffold465_cov383-Pavlova_lutheri.AAC.4
MGQSTYSMHDFQTVTRRNSSTNATICNFERQDQGSQRIVIRAHLTQHTPDCLNLRGTEAGVQSSLKSFDKSGRSIRRRASAIFVLWTTGNTSAHFLDAFKKEAGSITSLDA